MADQQAPTGIMQHFVLKKSRAKQVSALDYIERKYVEGYRDIVIAAPTGSGKSAMGSTVCFWSQDIAEEGFEPGGYYLVTQKMLQDQLQNDFSHYVMPSALAKCQSLKSAIEYTCPNHGNCAYGLGRLHKCANLSTGTCAYMRKRRAWENATLAVTNYPYLFTEHTYAGNLPPRRVLVLDECHTLERQILRFIEISVSDESLKKWVRTIKEVPDFDNVTEFAQFLLNEYLPVLEHRLEDYANWEPSDDSPEERKIAQDKMELEGHYTRIKRGADSITVDPTNWVFWQAANRKGETEVMAKPLDASFFSHDLVFNMGHVRIYMSAYPGSKRVFCRSLGLDPDKVAWLNLNSTFPVENRRVYLTMVGSMSKRNRSSTMPSFLMFVQKIMECHKDTKGIIHCTSYELGKAIYQGLLGTSHANRLLFPQSSDDRDPMFDVHKRSLDPTIIISPSMGEGFDFAEDLARWQIIAKIPYPYLGDMQISAKKDLDPEWYDLQAVSSIIQSCGRVVRSDTDRGDTYLLDSDFIALWEKNKEKFPRWFTDALVWPKRRTGA